MKVVKEGFDHFLFKIIINILTFIFQYARKTSSITRELSGNQFVIGDSEDESSEEEGD